MQKKLCIGIIREGKNPPDARVSLTPKQCRQLMDAHHINIVVQPSPVRCYTDDEYRAENIPLSEDLTSCDLLLGIKEVPIGELVPNKMYCFFSHTIKKQAHNKKLLQAILQKNIKMVDWETITNPKGERLIAFGYWAGVVGAHNGMMMWGRRTEAFELAQMKTFKDLATAKEFYKTLSLPPIKIVVTGTGRVGAGIVAVMEAMGIQRVDPADFLSHTYTNTVYTQLASRDYVKRMNGGYYTQEDFHTHPHFYESSFAPYTKVADLMMNGIFWKTGIPAFFTKEDCKKPDFNIRGIADITCDIAPESSIPCTLDASTIANPVFGYDIANECMTEPYREGVIDMMTIDNLPNELSRDASQAFGEQFIANVLPALSDGDQNGILERATIAQNGTLCPRFDYLADYVAE